MEAGKDKSINIPSDFSTLKERIDDHISKKRANKKVFINTMLLQGDGIDHINIWDGAETELGMALSPSYQLKFHHSLFGSFNSIETFWRYIQSKERDDKIRSLSGRFLKNFVHSKLTINYVTNFKAIIMDAHWQKISGLQPLVDDIIASTLPFDCYYINAQSNIRTRPVMYGWICSGMEEIRIALKEDRDPNFSFLLDEKNTDIYDFVNDHINNDIHKIINVGTQDLSIRHIPVKDQHLPKFFSFSEKGPSTCEETPNGNL